MQVFYRALKLILNHKTQLVAGILFMFAHAAFNVLPAEVCKQIVDGLSSEKIWPLSRFVLIGIGLFFFFVMRGVTYLGQNYLMGSLGQKLIKELRDRLFHKIVLMPIPFFNKYTTGNLISRITIDLNTLNEAIIIGIVGPARDIPTIVGLMAYMVYSSWKMSLLLVFLIPTAALAISKFGQQSKKVTTKRLSKYGDLTNLLTETITGIRVVKAFNMEKYEIDRFDKENRSVFHSFMQSIRIASFTLPTMEVIGGIFAATVLSVGGFLINHDQISAGEFAGFVMAFWMITQPLKKLSGFVLKVQEGASAAERIFSILDDETEIKDAPDAIELPPVKEEIHLKIDRFCYEENEFELRNIDIKLKAGSINALVGTSGGGKTTLSNLIPRFYDIEPENGSILIDGHNLRDVTLHSLRKQIALVTQDIVLFNDTIANNISYGDIDCSRENVIEAAKAGFADEFICEMPNGYDQPVGEKGIKLSGGQRQRIAISRALIKNAPILILDEATSALDTESEKQVQAAIENLMKNRTTLVIAHRLSTIQHADIIHVLQAGRIVESGAHKELMEKNGEYRKLYNMQFQES